MYIAFVNEWCNLHNSGHIFTSIFIPIGLKFSKERLQAPLGTSYIHEKSYLFSSADTLSYYSQCKIRFLKTFPW